MSEHTPGPWHTQGIDGVDVASGPTGCLAYVSTAGARGPSKSEAQANARLIAASPELFEACKMLLDDLAEAYSDRHESAAIIAARAVLAKIKGDA